MVPRGIPSMKGASVWWASSGVRHASMGLGIDSLEAVSRCLGRVRKHPQSSRGGFTLVEAAIVLILLGIIAALVIPAMVASTKHEKRQEAKEGLLSVRHAIIEWANAHGDKLPANLTAANILNTDVWGREYIYAPFSSALSICTDLNATPVFLQKDNTTLQAAFLLASLGHDPTQNAIYPATPTNPATPVDLTNPYDDLIEWVGKEELFYLICTGGSSHPPHNATKHILYSNSPITIPSNSAISGSVASDGSITLNQNTNINGILYSGGSVNILLNTSTSGIIANGAVSINQNVNIYGDVHVGGSLTIGANTHIYGNVYAGGSVTILGTVHGNVSAGGLVDAPSGSVTGTIQQNLGSPVPGLQTYVSPGIPKMQTFSASGPNISSSGTLLPGNYGAVSIPNNGQLTLHSGTYILASLSMGNNAQLRFNFNATGTLQDIALFVVGSANFTSVTTLFSTDNATYLSANNASTDAAKRVYLEAHGGFSFSGATSVWIGGVLTNGPATINAKAFVGHISAIPPGSFNLGSTNFVYVPSNFAQAHW